MSPSSATRSSSATATSTPPPASPPAWTSRSRWSRRTSAAKAALEVARWLVLFVKRPGGQSQFSAQLAAQTADREPLRELQEWIAGNLDADLSVPALAERAHMSERNFARAFREELGLTPAAYVEIARVEAARIALESTGTPVEVVARSRRGSAPSRRCAARSTAASAWARPSTAPASRQRKPPRRRNHADRNPAVRPLHRPRRDRPLRGALAHPGLAGRPSSAPRPGPTRPTTACSRSSPRPSLDDIPQPGHPLRAGRLGHPRRDVRRAPRELDPRRARDQPVDHVGLHRLAAAGRRGRARRPRRDEHWLELETLAELGATPDRAAAWSSRAR